MSVRDPQAAHHRQLHDLRKLAEEMERELAALNQEQSRLDRDLDRAQQRSVLTTRRRFWGGFGFGLVAVAAVWAAALGLAQAVVGP